jgi:hypothetical protein
LERGDFDVAITLAGAAEGMISREGLHLFSFLRESARAKVAYAQPKDWISALNQERDWLKHGGDDEMQIECFDAAAMIARAASKLEVWTPKMESFRTWFVDNLRNAAI